jgi:ribosome modulation factor
MTVIRIQEEFIEGWMAFYTELHGGERAFNPYVGERRIGWLEGYRRASNVNSARQNHMQFLLESPNSTTDRYQYVLRQGENDCLAGLPRIACPYPELTQQYTDWCEGWGRVHDKQIRQDIVDSVQHLKPAALATPAVPPTRRMRFRKGIK